jgi:hypothetical protein
MPKPVVGWTRAAADIDLSYEEIRRGLLSAGERTGPDFECGRFGNDPDAPWHNTSSNGISLR